MGNSIPGPAWISRHHLFMEHFLGARHGGIGYELLPQQQGKGIMKEVMPVVLEYGFNMMGLRSIVAELQAGNVRSVHLLEKHDFVRDAGPASNDGYVTYRLEK